MNTRLRLDAISVKFACSVLLNEVSFDLKRGEFLGLIGPNGAGKTTLLNVISGLLEPDGGDVFLDDIKVTARPAWEMAHLGIGRVFQTPQLLPSLTVQRNIEIAVERRWPRSPSTTGTLMPVNDLLSRIGISDLSMKRPGELTLFERRLTEAARALVNRPGLLLLDEPGAGCTEREREHYMRKILDLRPPDCSVILIEHDFQIMERYSDRVVLMDSGKVVADATCAELIHNPILHTIYLGDDVAKHK